MDNVADKCNGNADTAGKSSMKRDVARTMIAPITSGHRFLKRLTRRAQGMTLNDWIARYEAKTEPFKLEDGYRLHYEPDNGFVTYKAAGDYLILDHCCSDSMDWIHDTSRKLAIKSGCHFLWTQTMRNPVAFCRHSHAHLDVEQSGYRRNGIFYWVFEERI